MYKREPSPCFGCNGRFTGCHAKCAHYIDWKAQDEAKREALWQAKAKDRIGTSTEHSMRLERKRVMDRKSGKKEDKR